MAEWLGQLREKLVQHKNRADAIITAENVDLVEADLYYRNAQISCLTWIIGLANQAVDRRAAAADRRAAADQQRSPDQTGGR